MLPPPEVNTKNNPLSLCKKEWFRKEIPSFCFEGISMEKSTLARKYFYNNLKIRVNNVPNIKIFDSFENFCDGNLQKCKVQKSGELLYIDSNHLSLEGYKLILGKILNGFN